MSYSDAEAALHRAFNTCERLYKNPGWTKLFKTSMTTGDGSTDLERLAEDAFTLRKLRDEIDRPLFSALTLMYSHLIDNEQRRECVVDIKPITSWIIGSYQKKISPVFYELVTVAHLGRLKLSVKITDSKLSRQKKKITDALDIVEKGAKRQAVKILKKHDLID